MNRQTTEDKKPEVLCYSGYTYAERPLSFRWQGNWQTVQTVNNSWREPGEQHFQVVNENNKCFELCYDDEADQWTIEELA